MATVSSAIQAFATAEKATQDAILAAVNNVSTGVQNLDALIGTLQSSPGTISADDQATLDAAQAQSKQILAQLQAINTTPPGQAPPVVPQPAPQP